MLFFKSNRIPTDSAARTQNLPSKTIYKAAAEAAASLLSALGHPRSSGRISSCATPFPTQGEYSAGNSAAGPGGCGFQAQALAEAAWCAAKTAGGRDVLCSRRCGKTTTRRQGHSLKVFSFEVFFRVVFYPCQVPNRSGLYLRCGIVREF